MRADYTSVHPAQYLIELYRETKKRKKKKKEQCCTDAINKNAIYCTRPHLTSLSRIEIPHMTQRTVKSKTMHITGEELHHVIVRRFVLWKTSGEINRWTLLTDRPSTLFSRLSSVTCPLSVSPSIPQQRTLMMLAGALSYSLTQTAGVLIISSSLCCRYIRLMFYSNTSNSLLR